MALTPAEFVAHWNASTLNEIQGYQQHFLQLCEIVGFNPNAPAILTGPAPILFESNVTKAEGGSGRADVYRAGYFALEYKAKGRDLDRAYSQLQTYAPALNHPPLLIVSDFERFRIYPQWPNIDHKPWTFTNADLLRQDVRDRVYAAIADPERLLNERLAEAAERERVTEQLAARFAELARVLRDPIEGDPSLAPMQVARFLTKLIFAIFAEDVGLLPRINDTPVLEYIFQTALADPGSFKPNVADLFRAMNGESSRVFGQLVPYFNGGLFDETADDVVIDLSRNASARNILSAVNKSDWRWVSPSIFGTVFERALDPSKRAQLGAHYTSEDDIRLVIDPVLMQPLQRRWGEILAKTGELWPLLDAAPRVATATRRVLQELYDEMLDALKNTTVLDPACGSGNFLYMSLRALKDLEDKVHEHFKPLGLPRRDTVTPLQLYGIELNTFAAELARVVVWIGYLQWRFARDGYLKAKLPGKPADPDALPEPIIADDGLEHIVNDDAILRFDENGQPYEPEWPSTTVIVGNPPFLGGKLQRGQLGQDYVGSLHRVFQGRLAAGVDLVCYWYEHARSQLENEHVQRVGLLATNSIRDGISRHVLDRILETGQIYAAWADRNWILDGAAVNISIVMFDDGTEKEIVLDDKRVERIYADLTSDINLTYAKKLIENAELSSRGIEPGGPFEIGFEKGIALRERGFEDVVIPIINADDITGRLVPRFVIDLESKIRRHRERYLEILEILHSQWQFVLQNPTLKRKPEFRDDWWNFRRSGAKLRELLTRNNRAICTPVTSKYRCFVWMPVGVIPTNLLVVIAREDDYFFGVLHSYIHEIWALRLGTSLEDRPRYTPTTTFETFPFPFTPGQEDFTDFRVRAIAAIAEDLHEERDAWLNPPGVTDQSVLKKLTLTNLYNALSDLRAGKVLGRELFPFNGVAFVPRLRDLHDQLDAAVLAAYGWSDLTGQLRTPAGDEELLRRLLAENHRRAENQNA